MPFFDLAEFEEYVLEHNRIDSIKLDLANSPLPGTTLTDLETILQDVAIKYFELSLSNDTLDSATVLPLANIISLDNITKTELDLTNTKLNGAHLSNIAAAIANTPKDHPVTLRLGKNPIGTAGCRALASILLLGRYPKNFSLRLGPNDISDAGIQAICNAIKTCVDPQPNLHLDFSHIKMTNKKMQAICTMLMSKKLPRGFILDLSSCQLTQKHMRYLANAIKFGNTPEHFTLELGSNNLSAEDIAPLMQGINAGRCHPHFNLSLKWNPIGDPGAIEVANLLSSGNAPLGFELNIVGCDITRVGSAKLEEGLYSENRPINLKLISYCNKLSEDTEKSLQKAVDHMTDRDHDHYEVTQIKAFLNDHQKAFTDHKPTEPAKKLVKKFKQIIDAEKYNHIDAIIAYENYFKAITKDKDLRRPFKSTTVGLLFDNGLSGTDNHTVDIEETRQKECYNIRLNLSR